LRGYLLTIRKASDNSVAAFTTVAAGTTSIASPATLSDGETYHAVVTAVDNTADKAWTTDSDTLSFRVDTNADAASFSPTSGTILKGPAKSTNFTIGLDRVANPATVSNTTVVLDRSDGTDPSYSAGCANTPCTSITIDPSGDLAEGHYVLRFNGVKSADEDLPFSGSANYAVPFAESGSIQATTPVICATNTVTALGSAYPITAVTDPNQTAFLDFDISYSSAPVQWTMDALYGAPPTTNSPVIGTVSGVGPGPFRLSFHIGGLTGGSLQFRLSVPCPPTSNTITASNLFGSRYP
jgi:hypothetical protein